MEKDTTSPNSQPAAGQSVQAAQVDLVRASLLGPQETFRHGRRYGLNAAAMKLIRRRVHDATIEALSHQKVTAEDVALALELEVERAVWGVGVERLQ